MKMLRIGLAQTPQTADFNHNCDAIFAYLDKASDAGVQILCFPECQTVGYRVDTTPGDVPVPVERLEEVHQKVADRCGVLGMACILGTETPLESAPRRGKPYNSALVISENGEILGTHHKVKLTPLDKTVYSPGTTFENYELFGVTTGVVICYEGFRFAETTEECVRGGARIVFHPQNNTTRPNDWKIPVHHSLIVARAAENTIWFASCNCALEHQNSSSMIVGPDGLIVAQSELRAEELVVADIDVDLATRAMFTGDLDGLAPVLFRDTYERREYIPSGT
jgi:predicted amidohydrolase